MKRIMTAMVAVLAIALHAGAAWAAPSDCTIILMHGKWGGSRSPHLDMITAELEQFCTVRRPDMPWSRSKLYNRSYQDTLQGIANSVKDARAAGSKQVFVGGMSFGANAALAYQAVIRDADGLILLAPGHAPESMYERGVSRDSVDKAKALVAEKKAETILTVRDVNQGQQKTMSMRADVLLSYFDPHGLGNMHATAGRVTQAVPVFYAIGVRDPLYLRGPEYIFQRLPAHSASRYLVVDADHTSTPDQVAKQLTAWLKENLQKLKPIQP